MKKYLILFCIATVFLTSCFSTKYVAGVGEPVTEEIIIDEFDSFKITGYFDVKIHQGAEQSVIVSGYPNLLDMINRDVVDGNWRIEYDYPLRTSRRTTIEITIPDLKRIGISGLGNVQGIGEMELEDLNIAISGTGNVELYGNVDTQCIKISGSGRVNNIDLIAQKTTAHISGTGKIKTTSEEELDVKVSGVGTVSYRGTPDINYRRSGIGRLRNINREEYN